VGGEALSHGIRDNTTLLRLDYRMTGIMQEDASSINMSLKSNADRYRRKQELVGLLIHSCVFKCIHFQMCTFDI
jgi:hypothetical protein